MIGTESTATCFYLPTSPKLPDNWSCQDINATQSMIELNGNHWRKILTIMAKIMVNDQNWRRYRDIQLLKKKEAIVIAATKLQCKSKVHIVCGQESILALRINKDEFIPINAQSSNLLKHSHQPIYLCPYLDYRQFPNHQINLLRQTLGLQPLT